MRRLCLFFIVRVFVLYCPCVCSLLSVCLFFIVRVFVLYCPCVCSLLSVCLFFIVRAFVLYCPCVCSLLSVCLYFIVRGFFFIVRVLVLYCPRPGSLIDFNVSSMVFIVTFWLYIMGLAFLVRAIVTLVCSVGFSNNHSCPACLEDVWRGKFKPVPQRSMSHSEVKGHVQMYLVWAITLESIAGLGFFK